LGFFHLNHHTLQASKRDLVLQTEQIVPTLEHNKKIEILSGLNSGKSSHQPPAFLIPTFSFAVPRFSHRPPQAMDSGDFNLLVAFEPLRG
jgi:hypothetical protein